MPASVALYHEVRLEMTRRLDSRVLSAAARDRFALLVTGVVAAESAVVAAVAAELDGLGVTAATQAESITRRMRRVLSDERLTAETCYAPLVRTVIDWTQVSDAEGRIVLILDESSHTDRIHLLRVSLPYRGGSLPLAWTIWTQNVALPAGGYWTELEAVLAATADILPPERAVVVLADRAYAVPALIDRLTARGWHWALRLTTTGSHRLRPIWGEETSLQAIIAQRLDRPGRRMRIRGELFKDAGWRPAQLVGIWGAGAVEPLVVITDLPAHWSVLALYGRRFGIESGFRNDKSRGWEWEDCQVRGMAHHAVLLLALAWATVAMLCLGATEAAHRVRQLGRRPPRLVDGYWRTALPQPARESLFTMGLRAARAWLYRPERRRWRWKLPEAAGACWTDQWRASQANRLIFPAPPPTVRS